MKREIPSFGNLTGFDGKKSGITFTATVIAPLIISFVFVIALTLAAGIVAEEGQSSSEVVEGFSGRNWYIYLSYFLNQAAFFLVAFGIFRFYKLRPSQALPLNKISVLNGAASAVMSFGVLYGLNYVNVIFLKFLQLFGYSQVSTSVPAMNSPWDLVLSILIIAVLPAVCEETLFRGIILSGLRKCGDAAAIVISGLLFSIFHQSPLQTPYQFLYGMILAFVVIRTSSLLPAMIMHFLNNATILTMNYINPEMSLSPALDVILTVSGVAVIAAFMCYFAFFVKNEKLKKEESPKEFLKYAAAGIAICALMWVINFVTFLE